VLNWLLRTNALAYDAAAVMKTLRDYCTSPELIVEILKSTAVLVVTFGIL
jgi:hypothetical protein